MPGQHPDDWMQAKGDHAYVSEVLAHGTAADLAEAEELADGFPDGVDPILGRSWMRHAVEYGSRAAIEWMLARGVDLSFQDAEGYTVVHLCLEKGRHDRHEILALLLEAGAPRNVHGPNGWTPLHMAVWRGDPEALRILLAHGADPSVRTLIDDYSTPLEDAERMGYREAIAILSGEGGPTVVGRQRRWPDRA